MNLPSAPNGHQTADLGAHEVSAAITRLNGIALSANPNRDYGIDLFCAVRDANRKILPYTFAIQVKAEESSRPGSGRAAIPVDQHELYWSANTTPVYCVNWYTESRNGLVGDTLIIEPSGKSVVVDSKLEESIQEMYFRTILCTHDRNLGMWYRANIPFSESVNLNTWGKIATALDSYVMHGANALSWWAISDLSQVVHTYVLHLDALKEVESYEVARYGTKSLRGGPLDPKYVAEALTMELFQTIDAVPVIPENAHMALAGSARLLNNVCKLVNAVVESSLPIDRANWHDAVNEATAISDKSSEDYNAEFEAFYDRARVFDRTARAYRANYSDLFDLLGG